MFTTIQGSAHDIAQVADKSVQLICTSPPYYGLRAYDGDQTIEWPTVEYAPMPGLPPIRVQGCEPGCVHEWKDGRIITQQPQRDHDASGGFGSSRGTEASRQGMAYKTTQGAYCIHCGGWRGGLGLEPDPFAYVGHLILCLREWRRVLRDDGLCFVNLGDSYSGSGKGRNADGTHQEGGKQGTNRGTIVGELYKTFVPTGLKPKDLMQIPQRFALAAQADGWFLRSAIVWAKGLSFLPDYAGSCMPESVTDRPTQGYEMVYMLAKSERYFCDMESVKEANSANSHGSPNVNPGQKQTNLRNRDMGSTSLGFYQKSSASGRNLRNVWAISPVGFSAAHFACWPERMVEPMIKMGTSARGACPACGAPWRRVVEKETRFEGGSGKAGRTAAEVNANGKWAGMQYGENIKLGPVVSTTTTGWEPTCTCPDATEPQSCVVLDPFSGSGTTGKVAVRLGRRYIGVDLSEKYLTEITESRMGAGVQMELSW